MPKISRKKQGYKNYKSGLMAEFFACVLLKLKFYKILKIRYISGLGEVDIIAKKGDIIVFVEVKNRKEMDFGIVSNKQQKRICDASKQFLAKNVKYGDYNVRFDLIFVGGIANMKHIKNAWYA